MAFKRSAVRSRLSPPKEKRRSCTVSFLLPKQAGEKRCANGLMHNRFWMRIIEFAAELARRGSDPAYLHQKKRDGLGASAIKQVYMSNNEPPKVIKDYFRRCCYFL